MTMREILTQEKACVFEAVDADTVTRLIDGIFAYAEDYYNRPVSVRITFHGDVVGQRLGAGMGRTALDELTKMDDWVETHKHSSLYVKEAGLDDRAVGGGFPLIVNDQVCGSIACTGLGGVKSHTAVYEAITDLRAW